MATCQRPRFVTGGGRRCWLDWPTQHFTHDPCSLSHSHACWLYGIFELGHARQNCVRELLGRLPSCRRLPTAGPETAAKAGCLGSRTRPTTFCCHDTVPTA